MWPCIITNLFLIKPTDALISQIYFSQETLHVSGSSSAHHQEFSTIHSTPVYVMQFCWQLSSMTRMVVLENCQQTCMTYTSAECTVENSWWWAEELPEACRVHWQKWIWEISASVGFIKKNLTCWEFVPPFWNSLRMYPDAETCRNLILFMNGILLSAFVGWLLIVSVCMVRGI
jgi:hypothetical protein